MGRQRGDRIMSHPIDNVGKQCMVFFGNKWRLGRIERYDFESMWPMVVSMKEINMSLSFDCCDVHTDLEAWEREYGKIWGITFKKKAQA